MIFTRRGVDIERYSAILKHLAQYKQQLMPGAEGGRKPGSYKWYEVQDNIGYWKEFEKPKIIYPDIAQRAEFAFDKRGYYLRDTLYLIPTENLCLLGVLNSRLIFWCYAQTCATIRGGFVRYKSQYVSEIPIRLPVDPLSMERLVGQILAIRESGPKADVSALETQIDQLVYQLYGLTREEIAIVEGAGKGAA